MKPVYALTICLGLLEGADAIAIPEFVSPKVGYSTPLAHGEKKAEQGSDANSSPRVFGAYGPKSKLVGLPPVRRSDKTEESYGSDDGVDDDDEDDSGNNTADPPGDSPDSDDPEIVYPEPMMAPAYVRTGALPVDKPEEAPKSKSSKVDTKSKSKSGSKPDDTVHTAKHGGDDDSESGSSGRKSKRARTRIRATTTTLEITLATMMLPSQGPRVRIPNQHQSRQAPALLPLVQRIPLPV
ncbi:hypothetical protein NXS19_000307 [Fusarium pseudograminearum]|nr:hypothetical protein NXS19_000307 [Fusarium pseudograminearum]